MTKPSPPPEPEKRMMKLMESLRYRHGVYDVFRDFCELSACAVSNAADWRMREKREAGYMKTVGRYTHEEAQLFPEMLSCLVEALDSAPPADVLGRVFEGLEITNKDAGQFFTPQQVSDLIGRLLAPSADELSEKVRRKGFITVQEPAVGGGSMVFGLCRAMTEAGLDYRTQMHVTAIDTDLRCVHMAYVQMSLLGIPAVVWHGNTLSLEMHSSWVTPAHIIHGWDHRLRRECEKEWSSASIVAQGDFGWDLQGAKG